MKAIIKNNFRYYVKNSVKLFLSLVFILSFFYTLNIYDKMEVNELPNLSNHYRSIADEYRYPLSNISLTFIYDNFEYIDDSIPEGMGLYFYPEYVELNETLDYLRSQELLLEARLRGLAQQYASGRANFELTPYRLDIMSVYLNVYNTVDHDLAKQMFLSGDNYDLDYIIIEHERLSRLMDNLEPDYLNKYTITAANTSSKFLEGTGLFILFILILALFYDLYSKDFASGTYKLIYSEPINRKKIVFANSIFAILYTFILITLGLFIISIYLMIVKRSGYNIVESRVGYILHPVLININPLSLLNQAPKYLIVPQLFINIIHIFVSTLLITFWISLISLISFKSRSNTNSLAISGFLLLIALFVSLNPFAYLIKSFIPIFNFNYFDNLTGISNINIIYIIIFSIISILICNYFLYKNIESLDLLDGDKND